MERETKKIILPVSGKEVEVKTFFNMREKEAVLLTFSDDEGQNSVKKMISYQSELINQGVVSLDGSKENILERLKTEYRAKDYKFIVENLVESNKEEDEKKGE